MNATGTARTLVTRFLLPVLAACAFVACDRSTVFEKNISIPEYRWDMNNVLRFEVEIKDTASAYNIYLNVRNGSNYPYSNLFLFMNTMAPGGMMARDTVELVLADETGKWLGSGIGSLRDSRILFKKNYRFPRAGTYRFSLQQAMRVNPLPEIADAGIRIEFADTKQN
jgi:gliding motility-associated lipoprotein GldH